MLNHVRTLLLNEDGNKPVDPGVPGEELVPREYRAVRLPGYLQTIRQQLFGADPDRAMLNFRLQQYMTLLHATEFEIQIRVFGSRISYDPRRMSTAWLRQPTRPTVEPLNVESSLLPLISGTQTDPEPRGKLYYEFEVTGSDGGEVSVQQFAPDLSQKPFFTPGLLDEDAKFCNPLELGDTGFSVMAPVPLTPSSPPVVLRWRISGYRRPTWDVGQIAAGFRRIGEPVLLQLFGLTADEPWATYRNMFKRPEVAYSLGAVLMAVAHRTDELRKANA